MLIRKGVIAVLAVTTFGVASAADLMVTDAWVRGTVPAQKATGAFMSLSSKQGARIIAASSPAAGTTEIHSMVMEDGVMKMRPLSFLEVPAGVKVDLKPGGYHIMLMQLKAPLVEGNMVPITLIVEGPDKQVEEVPLEVPARALASGGGAMGQGGMKHDPMKMPH